MIDGADAVAAPPAPSRTYGPVRYAPVHPAKLVALSFLTFGFYQVVWFYRSWRYVKKEEGEKIWVWPRALFAPLVYHGLLKRLGVERAGFLALAYIGLSVLWRLPDPWWFLSLLSVLTLLPANRRMIELNRGAAARAPAYGWRKRSAVVACLGVLVLPLVLLGSFGPPTTVIDGEQLGEGELAYLRSAGIVEPDEEVVLFYSAGFLSIEGQGVVASDLGVTSYWTDPVSEELMVAFIAYGDIADVEVNAGSAILGETVVRLVNGAGDWLVIGLSTEAGGDRRFLAEIERRRPSAVGPGITA